MKRTLVILSIVGLLPIGSQAQFFTDAFNYANGDLTITDGTGDNVSGGLWAPHSGQNFNDNLTVLNSELIINNSGSEDANRLAGPTMGAGDTWYYGLSFRVNDMRTNPNTESINNDYFAHFLQGTSNFRGRAYLDNPNVADPSKYTLGLSASSGGQAAKWGTDLDFGVTYQLMVSYDYDTGLSEMWVNPVNIGSTKISDTAGSGAAMVALAFRQDFITGSIPNNQVVVGIASIGDDFDQVLAAVVPEPTTFALGGFGLLTLLLARRRS